MKNQLQTNILDTIRKYLPVEKKGNKWTGLCPFHTDRHPSLTVDPVKQRFICYACGAKGDAIEFVRKMENCSFHEALRKLGIRENAPTRVPDTPAPALASPVTIPDHESFLRMLLPWLPGHPELSATYLEFETGMAPVLVPPPWKALSGRIIFPLRESKGKLTGFAGRSKEGKKVSKYINTSAADGYDRNRMLYGLHKAASAIRLTGTVILTEGYKDVIALHAAGFTHAVGICGTAFTGGQLELLKEHDTATAFLLMDNDEAGQKAAQEISATLRKEQIQAHILPLPAGHDPDSFFRENGREYFRTYIEYACNRTRTAEWRLIQACLHHPEEIRVADQPPYPFPVVAYAVLQNENLPFSDPLNQELLNELAAGTPETLLPASLKQHCETLRKEAQKEQETDLRRIILLYLEERLELKIRKLLRRIRHPTLSTGSDQLPAELTKRQSQLHEVSHLLERNAIIRTI